MEWLSILQWGVGTGVGVILGAITQLSNFKPNKKIKNTEAQTAQFAYLEKEIDYLNKRIDDLYRDLGKSEEEKRQYRLDLEESEIKRYRNKSIIAVAYKCPHVDNCPVVMRRNELDQEWAEKQKEKLRRDSTEEY